MSASVETDSIIANTFIQFQGFQEPDCVLEPNCVLQPNCVLEPNPNAEVHEELPVAELPVAQPIIQDTNAAVQPPEPPVSGTGTTTAPPNLEDILDFTKTHDFGILKIKLADTPMTNQPQLLYFKNDMSGSMDDPCSDGRTKMQHAKHSINNILSAAAQSEDAEIWAQVDAFDDKVERIVPPQRVTKDNLSQLVALVNTMMPRNGTNLELALTDSKEQIIEFNKLHPEFAITQIFTTDGQANVGSQSPQTLAECVDPTYNNIFIGFGIEHSAETLAAISSRRHSAYYFIDKIENGGLVFGEVIHGILYKALINITLTAENAELYNYRTNQWSNTLDIDSLTGEAEKTYHLRITHQTSAYDVDVKISATIPGQTALFETSVACMPPLIDEHGIETPEKLDLSKYIFRQHTQELLYDAQHNRSYPEDLRRKMRRFLKQMNAYKEAHPELANDSTFQTLNDDLVIVIRTLGTQYQAMYAVARGTSNGRETSYNVSEVPAAPRGRYYQGGLTRANAFSGFPPQDPSEDYEDAEAEVNDELRMLSQVPLVRSHTTPRQATLMRAISAGTQAADMFDVEPETRFEA